MITYPSVKATGLLDKIAGGKVTLGTVPGAKYDGLTALPGDLLGLGLGVLFIVIAFVVPEAPRGDAALTQPAA